MKTNWWVVARSLVSALFIVAALWAGIADWPHGIMLYQLIGHDGAFWLWEMLILFVAWHAVIWWTVYWEVKLRHV